MTEALVLLGRLVTFDPARPEVEDGALYIGADERIAAVQSRTDPAPGGFESARRVRTGGAIYPGLIDLHSHVVYNVLPLWAPPGTTEPFVDRKDWPKHGDYEGTVSDPANALGALAGKAHLKYCEVKAVVGGTTAIQGSAKVAAGIVLATTGGVANAWVRRGLRPKNASSSASATRPKRSTSASSSGS